MKLSRKTLILISVAVLSLVFIIGLFRSYSLHGDAGFGLGYILGNSVAITFTFLVIITFVISLGFLINGIVKSIKKMEAKKSFITSAILFGASVVSLIVLATTVSALANIQEDYQKAEAQKKQEAEYLTSAATFYTEIDSFEFFATQVLSGYSTAWSDAINNRRDFNAAISSKKEESKVMISGANVLYESMGKELKVVSEAAKEQPNKYKEVYEEYKKIFEIVTALNEQVQSPSGSLITFNQNANSLIQEYKKVAGNINIVITDEIQTKAKEIKASYTSKNSNN